MFWIWRQGLESSPGLVFFSKMGLFSVIFIHRLLADQKNLNVYAVEPNEEMRNGFKKNLPDIQILDGTASSIPFQDGFFQVVFVAQAFHWFSNIESLREIHRVIKPQSKCKFGKSGLLLIWNMEDREAEPYIGELRDLYEKYDFAAPQYRKNEWQNVFRTNEGNALFSDLDTRFIKNSKIYLPISYIWLRVLSKSYVASLDESEKLILKKRVEDVIENYKNHQIQLPEYDEMCLHFPYYTEITWCFNKNL